MSHPTDFSQGQVRWGLCCGLLFFVMSIAPGWAVDPLPPDIEQASPEVKARYLEMTSRQSLEEKMKVGRERHRERVQLRQSLHDRMMSEVHARQAELTGNYAAPTRAGFMSYLKPMAVVVACGIAIILLVHAWRRTALAS